MSTKSRILRHINSLPAGEPFTTRDLVIYGTRSSVDQSVYRLVKTGIIRRLAWGVFVKPALGQEPIAIERVALVKARAFGRKLFAHAADVALKLGLISEVPSGEM